jgi:membrane DNA delivery protein
MAMQAEHDFWGTLSAVALAIVGVAMLALIVSNNAQTSQVISATGSAFSNALGVAISPVTGASQNSGVFPIA